MRPRALISAFCFGGLAACGQGPTPEAEGDQITLRLNRLQDGGLEYCDPQTNECRTLDYRGDCAFIEITVDTATGQTCQVCILEDGTRIDNGCDETLIGCVLITLPEPDCVVCAYFDGAVVFSTCVVDEPKCVSDRDCIGPEGMPGRCLEGECVYEPYCLDDSDCPPGFECEFYRDETCGPDDRCGWSYGICVPREIRCLADTDCPSDMFCDLVCWEPMGCPATDPNCMPEPQCEGVCRPLPQTCDDIRCPPGERCEMIPPPCEWGAYCPAQPVCIPDGCWSDAD